MGMTCLFSATIGAALVALCLGVDSCPNTNNQDFYENVAVLKASATGILDHYYIGGLFGVHEIAKQDAYVCSERIRNRGIVNLEAFFWSIKHFQSPSSKLKIGGVAFDSCGRQEQTVANVLSFAQCILRPSGVDRRQLMAYVGPDRSSEALAISKIMQDLNMTYISHAATSTNLSDSTKHPFFLRTTPSDAHDAVIMANVLGNIEARYTMILYLDNDYGRAGMMKLSEELNEAKVCVEMKIPIPVNPNDDQIDAIVDKLVKYKSIRYVALFADSAHSRRIMEAVNQKNGLPGSLVFIGTSSLGSSSSTSSFSSVAENSFFMSQMVNAPYVTLLDQFKIYWKTLKPDRLDSNYQNEWLKSYWEQKFNCDFVTGTNLCNTTKDSFDDSDIDVYTPNVIMAVQAIITGVKKAAESNCEGTLCSGVVNLRNQGTLVYETIKELKHGDKNVFNVEKSADGKYVSGDVSNEYSAYNIYIYKDGDYKKAYEYKPQNNQRILNRDIVLDKNIYTGGVCPSNICPVCNPITTPPPPTTPAPTQPQLTGTTQRNQGGMRKALVSYPWNQEITGAFDDSYRNQTEFTTRFDIGQRWIIPIGVLAGLGIFAVIVFEIYVMYKLLGSHNLHKWRTIWLGQLLLFGIFLSYLTLFAYIPIPTKATCGITRFGVGISYAIMFAVLLVKLMVILTSKTSDSLIPGEGESSNYLKGIYQFLMFMFAVAVQVVIGIQWLITVPPQAIKVKINSGEYRWICNHYTWSAGLGWNDMSMFVRSEFENHVLSLIYIMVLILITTILALKSHGIITNNRESVFIGISAGFSIPIWLAWTLVGGLNGSHAYANEFGDACIAFGLFLTATLIMFSMFLPKVRQLVNMGVEGIYFEDDHDTVYNESIILPPPSYKSRPGSGSVIYVNNSNMYADPVMVGNGDGGNHLRYSTAGSMYSSPPGLYRKAESTIGPNSKVLKVTGDLTGRRRPQSQSDIGYGRRSEKGTLPRSRSSQNIGAL